MRVFTRCKSKESGDHMVGDRAAMFSAVAAGLSALTAVLVYCRDWISGRLRCLPPRCYWVGYMGRENREPRISIALPIHAVNTRGVSGVLEDMMLRVKALKSNKFLMFQPELQIDINKARGTLWEGTELFIPLVVAGKKVTRDVVIFGHRAFRGDPQTRWLKGEYLVVAEETTTGNCLFKIRFKLDQDFVYGDKKSLTIRTDCNIMLSPRRWTKETLNSRDYLGRRSSIANS